MSVVTMKQLLEAGVHFGHNTRRWNPKMKEYIFGERNGIYIIDLQQTEAKLNEAYEAMKEISANEGRILFVGTRKQTQEVIRNEATRAGQFYIDQRWLGGTLTNFKTIRKSINRLFEIEQMEEDGVFEVLPKKEVILLNKERDRLEKVFSGIRDMDKLPQALFVVDPKSEYNAVREAQILNIPVFGMVDTNCDPDLVDYIIPANDDAIRAVKLIVGIMANAVVEGQGGTPIEIDLGDDSDSRQQGRHHGRRGGYQRRDRRQPGSQSGPRPQRDIYREQAQSSEENKEQTETKKEAAEVEETKAVKEETKTE